MEKLVPAFQISYDAASGVTIVNYTIFTHGEKLKELKVTQQQINEQTLNNLPGVRIELDLITTNEGNPFNISGTFKLDGGLQFDKDRPYLDIGMFVVSEAGGDRKRRGGGITRHEDIDMG